MPEDIRTGKKYFVKVLFCNDLEQVYVEKESKVQLYSPYIIRIYGGMLDEKNKRFITLVEYIEESDLSELMRGRGIAGDTWNEKMKVRNRIAMKFLLGIDHYMSMYRQDPIVHRDLKPENVLASPDGSVVKIIDFDWVHLHASNVTVMLRREQKGRQDMPIQDIGTVISAGRRWIFILPDLYFILFIQGSIISMENVR